MSIVRLLFAWLLLAALPLQGFAAATMLLCGQGAISAQASEEDHAAHGHHHGDGHAAKAGADAGLGHVHQADAPPHAHDGQVLSADHDGQDHACGVCASCCHVLALSGSSSPMPAADSPSAELPQPQVRILTRASPRPDKPPRA